MGRLFVCDSTVEFAELAAGIHRLYGPGHWSGILASFDGRYLLPLANEMPESTSRGERTITELAAWHVLPVS